jgi:hypothetical protein
MICFLRKVKPMQRPSRQLNLEAVRKWAESLSTEDRTRWLDIMLVPDGERQKEPTVEQQPDSPLEPDGERAKEPTVEQTHAERPDGPVEPDGQRAKKPAVEQQGQVLEEQVLEEQVLEEQVLEEEQRPLLPPGSIVLLTVILLVGVLFVGWLW